MNWQNIETAPRDGTKILVWGGEWVGELGPREPVDEPMKVYFCGRGGWHVADTVYYCAEIENPTHWMPLPAGPSSAKPEVKS